MPRVTPLREHDPRRIGRYRIIGRIVGMPGSGPAFLGRMVDGTEVSLTLPPIDWHGDAAARDRFAAEAAAARRVAPFCAARILDAGLEAGRPFLVSEFVPGPSLLEAVSARGPMAGADLESLAIGCATGLAAIHQAGLVHGSFGPEHVILAAAGPRVIEFGITPPYGSATPAADMRAWAQTIGYAATGATPASPRDLGALPAPLRAVTAHCLGAEPAVRPSAREALLELLGLGDPPAGVLAEGSRRAAAAAGPADVSSAGMAARPRQAGGGRHRGLALTAVAAVVLLISVVVVAIHLAQDSRSQSAASASGSASGGSTPSQVVRTGPASSTPATGRGRLNSASIPAAMAGVWAGQVRQVNPADVFGVRISLTPRARSGTISYSGVSFACSGQLSVSGAAGGALTLSQSITSGQSTCANGVVTLRPANGNVAFSFRGQAGPALRGTLARQ